MNNEYRVMLKRYLNKKFDGCKVTVRKNGLGVKIGWTAPLDCPLNQDDEAKVNNKIMAAAETFRSQWVLQNTRVK